MSDQKSQNGAIEPPKRKGLSNIIRATVGIAALLGFAIVYASELTGNQASLFMKPQVDEIYGAGLTNWLSTISGWSVSIVLLLITLGVGARLTGKWATAGLGVMALGYIALSQITLPGSLALVTLGIVGASSIVVGYIRSAVAKVKTGLPIANNQVVGGFSTILSQAAPFAVAWSGVTYGAKNTWFAVACMLAIGCLLGTTLFKIYDKKTSSHDEVAQVKKTGWRTTARSAWTAQARRMTLINFISAVTIGTVLGPLTAEIHQRGLNQSLWVGRWAIGCAIAGFFMMIVWSRITHGLRDRGLFLGAAITLIGSLFAVLEHHEGAGAILLAGGLTVSLGANAFENSVYGLEPKPAEAVAVNFGRALGFTLGAQLGLALLAGSQYTWATLAFSVAGLLVTFLLRRHWVMPVEHPLTRRSIALWVAIVFGLAITAALVIIGGIIFAGMIAGVAVIAAFVFWSRHIIDGIKGLLGITALEERLALSNKTTQELQGKVATLEERLNQLSDGSEILEEVLDHTREILGLPELEDLVALLKGQFHEDLRGLRSQFDGSVQEMQMRLDGISGKFDVAGVVSGELVYIGQALRQEIKNIQGLARIRTNRLRDLLRRTKRGMNALSRPQYAVWITAQINEIEDEHTLARQDMSAIILRLRERRDRLARACASKMSSRRERLLAEADQNTRLAEALERGMNDLT